MSKAPALRVVDIVKKYGGHTVLDGISFEVARGEAVVLRGPNGAGKSTLLGIIAGTVIADAGSVVIADADLRERPMDARRSLRFLDQEARLPVGVTGREVIAFWADAYELAERERDDAAERTGLGPALDHLVTTYSVGMRRRLAFAASTVGGGALLLLDEPFAGVDAEGRARMARWLGERLDDGSGVLIAAHDRDDDELERLGARVVRVGSP